MILETVTAGVLALGAIIVALQRFGWLTSPTVKAATERADAAESELEKLRGRTAVLEARTDLRPIVEALEKHAEQMILSQKLHTQTLDKLNDLNGSLKANTVAVEFLSRQVIDDDLRPRRKRAS